MNNIAIATIINYRLAVRLRNGNKAYILGDVRAIEPNANFKEDPLNIYPLIGFSIDENNDIEYLQWDAQGVYIDEDTPNDNDILDLWEQPK